MATAGGGQRGSSGSTTFAQQGRDEFVQRIVSKFERRIGIETEVVGFILSGLAPEKEWQAGVRAGKIDLDFVTRLITEALELAAERAEGRERIVIDVPLADRAFHEVIEVRYGCPYPFFFC